MTTEPSPRVDLAAIRQRAERLLARANAAEADIAVYQPCEDIRVLLAEVDRLRNELNRRHEPPSEEHLTKLHDRAHQQPQSRVWRTVDFLIHQLDARQLQATQIRRDEARKIAERIQREHDTSDEGWGHAAGLKAAERIARDAAGAV